MRQPGQMNSAQFRKSTPRRVGPKVLRLQQIATGCSSVPRRGGQPSIRGTEAATQAVIRGVYVQILGNTGYAGERNTVEEIKLENGDISLREFVRQVARSNAFRRRYWSGLYICKAIEVMHRRILGRPSFGRWEIDSYFDTAARTGFYGVVDAMISSREYNETFGEDTVPYERFITATDRNARKVPGLRRPFDAEAVADLTPISRPDVQPPQQLRTVADTVPRNLADRNRVIRGSWTAAISGGQTGTESTESMAGSQSIKQPPKPTRSWSAQRWQPGVATPLPRRSAAPGAPAPLAPTTLVGSGNWRAALGSGYGATIAEQPGAAMAKALRPGTPQGFGRRQSLGRPVQLSNAPGDSQLSEAIEASYRQLLNRPPLAAERLGDAESQFRNGVLTVADFVGQIAVSDLFQQRIQRMAPLRGASAVYLALLGRAAQPAEVSRFLATRSNQGQRAAIEAVLSSSDYAASFGRDTVPYIKGLNTADGLPLSTVNRTANLYGGNAGLNPPLGGAL
jgi:phycobilisome core-membrane linker protein